MSMALLRLTQAARGPAGGALRRMSTAALPKEAPIKMYGIAGRYTNALYAAAANKSELLAVEADLKLFKETFAVQVDKEVMYWHVTKALKEAIKKQQLEIIDQIPRNPTGKTQKHELREKYSD